MQLTVVQRVLGLLLMMFSLSMLPPMGVSALFDDGAMMPFFIGFLAIALAGLVVWFPVRNNRKDLRLRDGFLIVVLFWTVLGLAGAAPLVLSEDPRLSITDAVFESLSGLTTTGATVIRGLDELPPSILYYRQQLQWLGGMGIIVLAVAILPMLGIGGMQLYRAETPGPLKDSKLTPRITETAKALWYIYLGLTIACALAYWLSGMDLFDAICHSFSTIAIGGFSTHDASIGFFDSPAIELTCMVFMLLAGVNFGLHFVAFRNLSIKSYRQDPEFRTYASILLVASVIMCISLLVRNDSISISQAAMSAAFQVISFGTTTGFTTTDYANWAGALPVMLIMLSFIGGCAGSTGGGIKVIRITLLFRQGMREIVRLVHPNAQLAVKLGKKTVADRVVDSVWGFFSAYVAIYTLLLILLLATGLDQTTAFSAVAACLNNLGPGLGDVAGNFADINPVAKWLLGFAMLLGRLEIFTLLVLFTPEFWRR